ncbi:hypothetical protein LMG26857_03408 [Achromobacter anxifer]|uniref:TrbI/VirB10 family protein n=1 Tax=Achromobacter anxifer TaxID=1287737 RepID=UPI00155D3043|nr:TrbI/VirB10 family protein [Achromobacter anxifer]CAB5514349.1 hypothetical protein LMG26857_03408 [Achromobacter anxifer]
MAGPDFSSSNKDISVTTGTKKRSFKPNELVAGMTKDTKKRWLIVMGGIAGGLTLMTMFMSGNSTTTNKPAKPNSSVVETSPKGLSSQKDWRAQTGAEVAALKREIANARAAQEETNAHLAALKKQLEQRPANTPAAQNAEPRVSLNLPPPPTPPRSLTPVPSQATVQAPPASAPMTPPPAATVASTPDAPAKAPGRSPARSFVPPTVQAQASATDPTTTEDLVPNERKGFLPGGSFSNATLISGVEAFTGGTAQSQPQPMVVRLDSNAVLPNAANYQIKGCHVLVSAWGDMSSERVYARLATLTCVDAKNRLVLSEEVEGVLVDSDGKNGIRGTLQDRQGAKLARSLLAGFAEGVSSAFGQAQSTVTNTALGSTSAILGKNIPKAGAYQGAATAAEQLADFYLKQAESTMPVIAVDAGRKVSVLFTKSKALKFETTDSYRTTPKEKLRVERKVD